MESVLVTSPITMIKYLTEWTYRKAGFGSSFQGWWSTLVETEWRDSAVSMATASAHIVENQEAGVVLKANLALSDSACQTPLPKEPTAFKIKPRAGDWELNLRLCGTSQIQTTAKCRVNVYFRKGRKSCGRSWRKQTKLLTYPCFKRPPSQISSSQPLLLSVYFISSCVKYFRKSFPRIIPPLLWRLIKSCFLTIS